MSSDEGAVGGNTPNSLLHTIVELKMAMSFQIAVNIQSSVKIVIFFLFHYSTNLINNNE